MRSPRPCRGSGFNTVLGRLTFDEKGNAEVPSYDIVWWTDGAVGAEARGKAAGDIGRSRYA